MGTVLGAFVARAGVQIDLVTRNAQHVAVLSSSGARVILPSGEQFVQKVNAMLPEQMSGLYDVIFLMTKQRENAYIADFLSSYLAPDGVLCTTQNGLPEYGLAKSLGGERVLGCAVSWGATYISPGCVQLTSSPDAMTFSLGSPFGDVKKLSAVRDILSSAGKVTVEENFIGARWSKLIINSAFSTLSAVTSLTFGKIASGLKSRTVVQAMLNEGISCALSCGVTPQKIQGKDIVKWLSYSGPVKKAVSYLLIPFAVKKHAGIVSGMYYDLIAGRRCDADFVCGEVVKHAESSGANVPVTRAALNLIRAVERGELCVSPDNISLLLPVARGKCENFDNF